MPKKIILFHKHPVVRDAKMEEVKASIREKRMEEKGGSRDSTDHKT